MKLNRDENKEMSTKFTVNVNHRSNEIDAKVTMNKHNKPKTKKYVLFTESSQRRQKQRKPLRKTKSQNNFSTFQSNCCTI